MLLFAGLGNPGSEHAGQRHNVGFMAADTIARRHSFSPWAKKFQGLIAEGIIAGEKIILIKPQTFMNLSGQSVGAALRFHKLPPSALTVFYDELDLAPGKVRIKVGGGAGGHNGIRSIDGHCGKDYRRVRIGIGHPGVKELVQPHVLGKFAKADAEWLDPLLETIADHADLLVQGDDNSFMNKTALAVKSGLDLRSGNASRPAHGAAQESSLPKAQSHLHQARQQQSATKLPAGGAMAEMLRKLLGK